MSDLRAMVAIAGVSLKRFLRDRSNIFFVFALPLLIVMLIGVQFGGGASSTVALVGGDMPVGAIIRQAFDDSTIDVIDVENGDQAVRDVEDAKVDAAVIVSDGDPFLDTLDVVFISSNRAVDARSVLQAAVDEESIDWNGARLLADQLGGSPDDYRGATAAADEALAPITVEVETVGDNPFSGVTRFNLGAATQLVLFTFLNALTASAYLILTRKLGVAQRMMASSTSTGAIVAGETLGKFSIALFQALYIVTATWLVFRVDWGDPLATGAVIVLFSLVGTALGVLIGSVLDNEGAASGIGVTMGISLGALGGAMVPSELFPDSVRSVSQLTPHYWALEGLKEVLYRGGSLADIGRELTILALYASVLLALAAFFYRRSILRT